MSVYLKLLLSILSGTNDADVKFSDLQTVLYRLGFKERIRGDHFIYTKQGVVEKVNIQPVGNKAKPYQVKQIRNLILKYKLGGTVNEV